MQNSAIMGEEEPRSRTTAFARYLSKENYMLLPDQQKKQLLEAWRADPVITSRMVQKALGWNTNQYYFELDRLGVPYKKKQPTKKRQKLASAKKPESSCAISFKGIYNPQQLLDQLQRLELLINESATAYEFELKLQEKQEN